MIDETQPHRVDPDGETRPILPGEDPASAQTPGAVDPDGVTQPYLPEDDPYNFPQDPFAAVGPVDPYAATRAYQPGPDPLNYYPYDQNQGDQQGLTQPYIPGDPLATYQPIPVQQQPQPPQRQPGRKPPRQQPQQRKRRRGGFGMGCGCWGCFTPLLLVLVLLAAYFLAPLPTNLLLLGLDRAPDGTSLSRTDTMILVSVNPLLPDVKMLSIPRDLWISIPGFGENRINTVHFFAEETQAGSGPETTLNVVRETFQVPVSYYVRVRFDGVTGIVDAMGGVDVNMPEAMSGYEAGVHHLNGKDALAFARDRKGTDDFFRMAHGQLLIKSIVKQMINPLTWGRLPQVTGAVFQMVDTNLPVWQWPRLGLAMVRAVVGGGIDNRTLSRDMATPFITSGGAQVLMPQWNLINPLVREMFGGVW